jgi:hypothetical protein
MLTENDVYRKIKEISAGYIDPRTPVLINLLTKEMYSNTELLLPIINQLVYLRLIKYNEKNRQSVRLTFLGMNVTR